ncbi:MAG: hypothetical protein ACHQDE_04335 [Acidimicrobiia bacterium]
MFLVVVWSLDRQRAWRVALIIGAFVVVMGLYNWARYGDASQFQYPGEGFTGDPATAARGLLFDPAKSVLLFAPCVVLVPAALWSLWSRARAVCALMVANLVLVFAADLFWHGWDGGWSWGPRLVLTGLVPALPALAPWIDGRRVKVVAVAALFVLGFAVSFATVLVPTQAQELDRHNDRGSPTPLRQYELIVPTARYTAEHLYEPAVAGTGSHRKYLSLWQANLARVFGRAGLAAAVVVTLLLFGVAGFALRAAGAEPTKLRL